MRTNHQFSQTKTAEIPRSSFDLSHGLKTTLDGGLLVPILSLEVLPGDTIKCRASLFGRLATPLKPVLDSLYMETFFFFTPWRQVWENWTKFMGEQISPGDSIDYTIPRISFGGEINEGTLGDYFGIPIGADPDIVNISSLPFRCYNAVYNFWFRDENLIDPRAVPLGDGPDPINTQDMIDPARRRKRRDYITSNLPWPQKGPAVNIVLAGKAPITGLGFIGNAPAGTPGLARETVGDRDYPDASDGIQVLTDDGVGSVARPIIYADLSQAEDFTINDLRESFQIQKLLERDARGGTRYPEILQSHFRVSDPGLLVHQRPVFLGGGHSRVNIQPVPQTSDQLNGGPGAETPQGNLAAYGTVSGNNHGFTASFTEHGHVLGLVNFRADLTYQEGLERYWSRQTRYDFYFPVLSHLGEQMTRNSEVYVSNDALIDDEAFGYMPRYDEYRFKQSQITGLFRSEATESLDFWHLAQDFGSLPTLNQDFIEDNPPIDRVVAVPEEPHFLLDVYFKIRAARPLPLYATPGLIDHF